LALRLENSEAFQGPLLIGVGVSLQAAGLYVLRQGLTCMDLLVSATSNSFETSRRAPLFWKKALHV